MGLKNIFKKKSEKETAFAKETPFKEGFAWKVLISPHITEKATQLEKKNQYVFRVYPQAKKLDIKKAVEEFYKVNVEEVRIIKIPSKRKRMGRIWGWREGYKKAIVKVKEGQKLDVLPK